jgi:glycosyltransferase involved in cell wall biosynthesis
VINHYTTIPTRDGAGHRHFRLAEVLSAHGWDAVLLLASTRHPSGEQYLPRGRKREVGVDGVVTYAMLRVPSYRNGVQRLRNMVLFALSLLRRSSVHDLPKPDIVVGSTVHLLAAWSALRLARRYRVPFVFEIRDIWPETLVDLGRLKPRGIAARSMRRFARHLCANADLVLSPLPGVRDYLDGLGLAEVPFQWISNGVELVDDPEPSVPMVAGDDFTYMYLGSLGNANGVRGLLEAFDRACALPGSANLCLRIVGDGTQADSLRRFAESLSSSGRVLFEPRIPRGEVVARAQQADALVVNIEDLPVYRFGISLNKLFDYLAASRPVVIATSAINNPVADAEAGMTVPAGEVGRLAEAMRRMSELGAEERAEMGRRGRAHVESNYTFDALGERLAETLNDTVDRTRARNVGAAVRKKMQDRSVVHVSSAHPYTDNRIHYRECRTLADAGFEVTLIAVESELAGQATDVKVVRLPRRRRLKRMVWSSFQAVRLALRSKARIVHLHDPELIPYIPMLRLAGRTVVFDAHEDLPAQVLDKPYTTRWTRGALSAAAHALLFVASRANLVVAATEKIAERFPAGKTILVHNYPPLREEESELSGADQRRDVAVYIGGMAPIRGIVEVLASVAQPEFPSGWELHLAGPASPDALALIEAATGSGRVVYHGQLAPLAARDLLLTAKVGLVTFSDNAAHRDSLPTKLFEYFAAGLPAVASDFPLWRNIIGAIEAGVLVDQTDPADIARAIAQYADSEELWATHSANARRAAVEVLNWAPEGAALVAAYEDLERG